MFAIRFRLSSLPGFESTSVGRIAFLGSKHGVSQMFILQQFSMVISHWSGLAVRGVTFLFTIIRFLILGRRLRCNILVMRTAQIRHSKPQSIPNTISMGSRMGSHPGEQSVSRYTFDGSIDFVVFSSFVQLQGSTVGVICTILRVSHREPSNPSVHVHIALSLSSLHSPPFRQYREQISVVHLGPEKPLLHLHSGWPLLLTLQSPLKQKFWQIDFSHRSPV